jgi:hypothetical protein
MTRKAARDLREELPEVPEAIPARLIEIEDREISRELELAQVLKHQGQIELDLDQETLARLRSSR